MIYLLCGIVVLFGLIKGVHEGITMYNPNPRKHPWYDWYHRIENVRDITAVIVGALFMGATCDGMTFWTDWTIYGALLMCWEHAELFYAITRFDIKENDYRENFLGLNIILSKSMTNIAHVSRIVISIMLLCMGFL